MQYKTAPTRIYITRKTSISTKMAQVRETIGERDTPWGSRYMKR